MLNIKKVGFTISVVLALLFSGCGGSDDATPDVDEPLAPTTVTKTISGVAVDGYISGATVCLDINSNDICDSDEPSTTTSDDGTFSFDTTATGNYPIIISGGTDTATDEAFDGVLKNIIELSDTNTSLSTNITPLTTLSANIYKENIKTNPDFTPTQAKQTMATNLGLTLAQIDKDPLKDKDVFTKAQQIIQTTKILQSSINIEDKDSFNHIMEQIATTIKEDTTSKDLNITKLIENLETIQYNDKNISISEDIKSFAKEYKDEISLKTEDITDINNLDNLQNSFKTYTNSAKEKISNNRSDTLSQTLSTIKENTTIELLQATNSKPTISNTPSTAIEEESTYTYTPNTTDSDNDTLVYTIVNKPTWATFDTTTGKLTGKPDVNSSNTYKDIVISVSDGIDTTTLSNFDIVVSPNIIGNVESKYYGKWIEAQSGDELSIDTTTILEYTAPNDDQLEIDINNTSKKYLRASLSKINLKGQLTKRTTTVRGLRDYATIGDIDVILQNILDPNIKATITTDTNGYFEDTSLPAGDYTIQANSNDIQIDTTISISDEQEDLGTFVLLEEDTHNFKAELFLNESFIIADGKMQNATIKVKNIGAKKSLGTNFSIKLIDENNNTINPADINYSDNTNDVVGSIFPDTTADINVSFAFEPIYKNNKDITIELSIMDADNNRWTETMKFVLYKGTFDINVATSQANVRGYIRLPYNKQILAIDMANGTLTLPLLQPTSHYPLVLANSNELEGETKYSIGIETKTEDFSNFSYTGIYEQNSVENPYGDDTEATANPIKLYESAKAYIHYGDLDYWKITTQEDDTKLHYDDNFETILNPT
ncbi:MAG: putative Ig domain-containing protein, partial [Campylobacterota bacterium]|nr:putative Ig domain-containing protein [Campylobacterota bacterium]